MIPLTLHRNAMLRVLTFAPYSPADEEKPHKRFFDCLWLAIMSMGDPRTGGARGRQAVKQARRIKVELRNIGQRLAAAEPGEEGRDAITLAEAGGTVVLAEDDFKKVIELVESVPWKGGNLDDIEDLFDWLDKTPQKKSSEVKAALEGTSAKPAELSDSDRGKPEGAAAE